MSVNSHYFAINSLTQLVQNQIKQRVNYPQQLAEIQKLIANFGFDCEQHVYGLIFECLYSSLSSSSPSTNQHKTTSSPSKSNQSTEQSNPPAADSERLELLVRLFHDLKPFRKSNFISVINFGFRRFAKKISIISADQNQINQILDKLVTLLAFTKKLEELGFRFSCALLPASDRETLSASTAGYVDPSSGTQDLEEQQDWEALQAVSKRLVVKVLTRPISEAGEDSANNPDGKYIQDTVRTLLGDGEPGFPLHPTYYPLVRFVFSQLLINCGEEYRTALFTAISDSIPSDCSEILNTFAILVSPQVPHARRDFTERNRLLDNIMDRLDSQKQQQQQNGRENGTGDTIGLTEEQVAHMVLAEGNGTLNAELLKQFPITPKLCAHFLCLLCEAPPKSNNNQSASGGQESGNAGTPPITKSEEIEQLAELCKEHLSGSGSPLMAVLQALDHVDFVKHAQSIFKTNVILYPPPKSSTTAASPNSSSSGGSSAPRPEICFLKFWQFCVILCQSEKQGPYIVTSIFFRHLWSVNLEFQFGFVAAMARSRVLAKLLVTSQPPSSQLDPLIPSLDQGVAQIETLKCQPDFEQIPELANWKFQRLYQILLDFTNVTKVPITPNNTGVRFKLAIPPEQPSDAPFYGFVMDLLKVPVMSVPDLLVLGVLGTQPQVATPAKMDLLTQALPSFLASHPNSASILHTVWNASELSAAAGGQTPATPTSVAAASLVSGSHTSGNGGAGWSRQALLQAMCDFYMKVSGTEQQQRLSRVLDVAQDLKALSFLLNGNFYPFVIDLACLASRREYLKLDKWFIDKIREHGESFVRASVDFLSSRCPFLLTGSLPTEPSSIVPLAAETVAVILACLQKTCPTPGAQQQGPPQGSNLPYLENLSQKLQEDIFTMISNSQLMQHLLRKATAPQPPTHPTAVPGAQTIKQGQQMPTPGMNSGDFGLGALTLNSGSGTPPMPAMPVVSSAAQAAVAPFAQQRQATFAPPAVPPPVAMRAPAPVASAAIMPTNAASNANSNQIVNQPERFRQAIDSLASIFPDAQVTISREIENEADAYFKRIFNRNNPNHLSVDQVLDMLRSFKDSDDQREREVFTCMIRNLFKEYQFFPQYPAQELMTTAQLFGGIIQMGLVKYMALVGALRYVLEALRKPTDSKMYYFGVTALDKFKTKLKDYPLYCQHLQSIPNFQHFPPLLIDYIRCGINSQEFNPPQAGNQSAGLQAAPNQVQGLIRPALQGGDLASMASTPSVQSRSATATPASTTSSVPSSMGGSAVSSQQQTQRPLSIANSTNIDTLLKAEESAPIVEPSEALQDKVAFIINNLSQVNLTSKAEDFKNVIGKEEIYLGWLSRYLVLKRASIEPNFHSLYANFIETVKLGILTDLVIKETYRNIKVLLRSDKDTNAANDMTNRTLLKNLGHWLGVVTIARSRAILHDQLNLKLLLVEAYNKGTHELMYVVPLIAKILESASKSRIFKPPNPWTMNIVKALVELHQEPNLKLNLKFEVEVLCKNLTIDLHDYIGKSTILKDRVFYEQNVALHPQLGSPQQSKKSAQPPQPAAPVQQQPQQNRMPTIQASAPKVVPPSHPPMPSSAQQQHEQREQLFAPAQAQSVPSHSAQQSMSAEFLPPGTTPPAQMPPTASKQYSEIIITSMDQLVQTLLQCNMRPEQIASLRDSLKKAIIHAVQEWIQPVVERSVKITLTTTEQIVKKDFALDPDENHMHLAAHNMIRHLTGGMALITCRDPLQLSMITNVRTVLARAIPEHILRTCPINVDLCAQQIANDNIEAACAFIQKTAIEKSLPEIDKRIATELEIRNKARSEGRRYYDHLVNQFHHERMPEQIRLKPGMPIQPNQLSIYEELGSNIPGLTSSIAELSQPSTQAAQQPVPQQQPQQAPSGINPAIAALLEQTASLNNLRQQQQQQPPMPAQPVPQRPPAMAFSGGFPVQNEPSASIAQPPQQPPQQPSPETAVLAAFEKLMSELDNISAKFQRAGPQMAQLTPAIQMIIDGLDRARTNIHSRDMHAMINILNKTVDALGDLVSFAEQGYGDVQMLSNARDVYLIIMKTLGDNRVMGFPWVSKQITRIAVDRMHPPNSTVIQVPDEVFDILFRAGLINTNYLDGQFSNIIETATSASVLDFPFRFLRAYGRLFSEAEFQDTVQALIRLANNSSQNTELTAQIGLILEGFSRSPPLNDPITPPDLTGIPGPNMVEKVERLLRDWISLYHSTQNPSKVFSAFVQQLNFQGFLKTDEIISRFFRLCTEMCVELCYRILASGNASQVPPSSALFNIQQTEIRNKCFHTLDAFTALIVLLIKHSGLSAASAQNAGAETAAKLNLLNKVLQIVVNVCQHDQELRGAEFQHLPYYRILIVLLMDLLLNPNNMGVTNLSQNAAVPVEQISLEIQTKVLTAFANTLHLLRPSKCPSFAYAWLDFISHRTFLDKCLGPSALAAHGHAPINQGWTLYASLLIDLIRFLAPFLKNVEMLAPIELLYRGTMKLLLVLLHDFPEFLCEYIYAILDVLPCNVIQMRNLILSAFPRSMRLPDPFAPAFKIDSLAEISQPPRGYQAISKMATSIPFKKELDSYLQNRANVNFLTELPSVLRKCGPSPAQMASMAQDGSNFSDSNNYNVPLMNALVLYVGSQAIAAISPKNISLSTISHTPYMDIFQNLAVSLDTEGRYLFLNAIANQLRYPNSYTHYFSSCLLYLFSESNQEAIQEQITRVLLERLVVSRPHPWGLLVTFIELVKNPSYKFWDHKFVHCAPEIDKYWQGLGLTFGGPGGAGGQGNSSDEPNAAIGSKSAVNMVD